MWTPFVLNNGKTNPYGFGFNVADFRNHRLISHGGQTAGFAASISRFVDDRLTVIVLTNLGDIGLGTTVARGIAKIYIPAISLRNLKEEKSADAKLPDFFKNALQSYLEDKLKADSFNEKTRANLTTARAKLDAKRIAAFGSVKKFVFVGSENAGKNRVYRYKSETSSSRFLLWRFELDENNQISALVLEEEE